MTRKLWRQSRKVLNAQADIALADWTETKIQNVCARNSENRLPTRILRAIAIACCIIKKNNIALAGNVKSLKIYFTQ